jgi:hypothetical protein
MRLSNSIAPIKILIANISHTNNDPDELNGEKKETAMKIKDIACGSYHSFFVSSKDLFINNMIVVTGDIFGCGLNNFG